VNLLLLS